MKTRRPERGFTLVEFLVSLAIMALSATAISSLMVQNSRINKAQQMELALQADARNCLSMVVQVLRTAGWDPRNVGFSAVSLDPDPYSGDNYIVVYADLDEDGATTSADEAVTIRHTADRIEWRKSSDTSQPFVTLAEGISNDADGDGTVEPMFLPDTSPNPTKITVRITAVSPFHDPRTGQYLRYTVSSDVVLRKVL